MVLTVLFALVVGCAWVHGSKLISQHDVGNPPNSQHDDILKHAIIRGDLDKKIADAKKEVGQAKEDKGQKTANHEHAVQDEQAAQERESEAEDADLSAREDQEAARKTRSDARETLELLEGQTAAIEQVEEATSHLDTAKTELAKAKQTQVQHYNDVQNAADERDQATADKTTKEAAESAASVVATRAALDHQTKHHSHESAKAMYQASKHQPWAHFVEMAVEAAKKDLDAATKEKQAADEALAAAKQDLQEAVNRVTKAKEAKLILDQKTADIDDAVAVADTMKKVKEQALQKAMEHAHEHFTTQKEIEDAKSDRLRERVAQAKTALAVARREFQQAKAAADQAAKELADAEDETQEATQKKLAAKYELEQAQSRLEMAQSDLSAAEGDLENAQKDSRDALAAAKKKLEQSEAELTRRTQLLDTHNGKVTLAKNTEDGAHTKLTEAEAHHADKKKCQQGSSVVANEARKALDQAKYWSGHTEILEKDHYWDGDFGPIHQAADTILKDKKEEYDEAKNKNLKHKEDEQEALKALQGARRVKRTATDARMKLDAQTPLVEDNFLQAQGRRDNAAYVHSVAKTIHDAYHQ